MRILGWMQSKLMHNTTEPVKSFATIGTSTCFSLSEGQSYCTEHPNTKSRKSNTLDAANNDSLYEPFDFLSIGTFGNNLLHTDDPPTPTLLDSLIEFTEDDLNMINLELEKFLDSEEAESHYDASQRSSHASVITLSYKAIDGGADDSEGQANTCPLQSYLFAASVETEREVKREKASLGELFKRSNFSDGNTPAMKCEGARKQGGKGNVAHFVKKVVKKFRSSASASDHDGGAADFPNKKILSKRLAKMFHKKVYPEEMAEKQFTKVSKSKNKNTHSKDVHNKLDQSGSKNSSKKPSWAGICGGGSLVDAGHWIKTDSDYLVLEL